LGDRNDTVQHLCLYGVGYLDGLWGIVDDPNIWGGNAWGMRVEKWREMGAILDWGIGGMCDFAFAQATMKDMKKWKYGQSVESYYK
jgi:hypothetical protein